MTDGVRALVHLNLLLEKHLSVSVIVFCPCLHNYFFPTVPIKTPPDQTVLLPYYHMHFFIYTSDMVTRAFNRYSLLSDAFGAHTESVPVFSVAIILWWCGGPLTLYLDHLAPKLTTETNANELNLGGLAASQWWVEDCSLHSISLLYSLNSFGS